jgi:hypothetical protein
MLIEDLQLLLNRRMRTRMYGGVGAAVSNGGGYPISVAWLPQSQAKATVTTE